MSKTILDVSRWQGTIDWEKVKASGKVDGAMLRAVGNSAEGKASKPYLWLAAYRTQKPAPGWPFGMWQYTSTGSVPGVSTAVDLSHAYKDYAGIIRRKGLDKVKGA